MLIQIVNMNVLSLFDGISCGNLALERAGLVASNYYSSEIDKYAINVTQKNYPNTIQLGDITNISGSKLLQIDLLIGGSPCQGFSFAGKHLNFEDSRSKLFFEFVRLLNECKPKYFLLENVKMKKEYENIISSYLGVYPKEINSSLFSAQNRRRLYWTNIPFDTNIKDKHISANSIIETNVDEKYFVSETQLKRLKFNNISDGIVKGCFSKPIINTDKSECLLARDYKGIPGKQYFTMCIENSRLRKLTPIEYERLQTIPDNYTNYASDSQRYKMIGNSWTVDVICHIFKGLLIER